MDGVERSRSAIEGHDGEEAVYICVNISAYIYQERVISEW
jgi:hypothetical protein